MNCLCTLVENQDEECTYDEVMRKVCSIAVYFETGMAKWKPNKKDACGFIRMCKKALEEAKQEEFIPSYLTGYCFWGMSNYYNHIIKLFGNRNHLKQDVRYGETVLTCNHIETYIKTKHTINSLINLYKDKLVVDPNSISFEDWVNQNESNLEHYLK